MYFINIEWTTVTTTCTWRWQSAHVLTGGAFHTVQCFISTKQELDILVSVWKFNLLYIPVYLTETLPRYLFIWTHSPSVLSLQNTGITHCVYNHTVFFFQNRGRNVDSWYHRFPDQLFYGILCNLVTHKYI